MSFAGEAAAASQWTISDDATGGDCVVFGIWDASSRTCTLTADVTADPGQEGAAIEIAGDNITLNGNGRLVSRAPGSTAPAAAVHVSSRTGVTIRNLSLENFLYGVEAFDTGGLEISDITASGNGTGIRIDLGTNSVLERNNLNGNAADGVHIRSGMGDLLSWNSCQGNAAGIRLEDVSETYLDHNTINGNVNGVLIDQSDHVSLYGNHMNRNSGYGISLEDSGTINLMSSEIDGRISDTEETLHGIHLSNTSNANIKDNYIAGCFLGIYTRADTRTGSDYIYILDNSMEYNWIGLEIPTISHALVKGNHFNENESMQVNIGGCMEVLWFYDMMPPGGNHWSDYDEEAEGCFDDDGNGFCDEMYTVFGEYKDMFPLVAGGGVCRGCADPSPPPAQDLSLSLSGGQSYWGSYSDFVSGLLSADFTLNNTGPEAFDVSIVGVVCTGGVINAGSLPALGDVGEGSSAAFTLRYNVPWGLASFKSTVYVTAVDVSGNVHDFPGPYAGA